MCNQTLFCQENEVSVRLSLLWMQLQKLLFWNGYFLSDWKTLRVDYNTNECIKDIAFFSFIRILL